MSPIIALCTCFVSKIDFRALQRNPIAIYLSLCYNYKNVHAVFSVGAHRQHDVCREGQPEEVLAGARENRRIRRR